MALNKTAKDRRELRRQKVAQLLVRRPRITVRQVQKALLKSGHYNPDTNEAWSIGTVQSDIEHVREHARENMERDANEWRAIELDRLQELQKEAWDEGDRDLVLRCMKRRANLLGLDAPEKQTKDLNVEGLADFLAGGFDDDD
jgi:hypothetical protein